MYFYGDCMAFTLAKGSQLLIVLYSRGCSDSCLTYTFAMHPFFNLLLSTNHYVDVAYNR